MLLTTLSRISKTSLLSFWRNRWLSLAATLIMILTLITISFFISVLMITGRTTESLRERVDMAVYFNEDASNDQIFAIQNVLLARQDIKSVDYISKEKALAIWRSRNKDNATIRDVISEIDNPLPRSLEIKTQNPEDLEKINSMLTSSEYNTLVKSISYQKNKALVDRLVRITVFIKLFGYTLSSIFVLISILIIYNTIRLTIFARSEEVAIMRLVGATDWYIRGPFIIEGLGYGLIGAIVSSIIYYFFFRYSVPVAERYLGLSNLNTHYLGISFWMMVGIQVMFGLVLGAVCSILAIRKHLND